MDERSRRVGGLLSTPATFPTNSGQSVQQRLNWTTDGAGADLVEDDALPGKLCQFEMSTDTDPGGEQEYTECGFHQIKLRCESEVRRSSTVEWQDEEEQLQHQ